MTNARPGLIAVLLLATAASAAADPAAVDTNLNLRAGPGPAFNVIVKIPAGSKLEVQSCGEDWCRVKFAGRMGYASRPLLRIGVDSYASAAPRPAPVEPKATLTGPTVWQWRDQQWRDEHWRQLDWHNRLNPR